MLCFSLPITSIFFNTIVCITDDFMSFLDLFFQLCLWLLHNEILGLSFCTRNVLVARCFLYLPYPRTFPITFSIILCTYANIPFIRSTYFNCLYSLHPSPLLLNQLNTNGHNLDLIMKQTYFLGRPSFLPIQKAFSYILY